MLKTSEIVAMTTERKVELLAKAATQMLESRYAAAVALASLDQSGVWRDAGFRGMHEFAVKKSGLDPADVSTLLWVGRKLLILPELAESLRDGRLTWSKVRALVPHVTRENAAEWIGKATRKTSNALEREIGRHRDASIGGPTRAVHLTIPAWRRFEHLAKCLRLESGDKNLPDAECLLRIFDEFEAAREARQTAPPAPGRHRLLRLALGSSQRSTPNQPRQRRKPLARRRKRTSFPWGRVRRWSHVRPGADTSRLTSAAR